MTPEEFIQLIESIYNADRTGGAVESVTYLRAIYIGYEYPNLRPPAGDDELEEAYKFGLELRKRYHEKFK